jgi:hypothetical protein
MNPPWYLPYELPHHLVVAYVARRQHLRHNFTRPFIHAEM